MSRLISFLGFGLALAACVGLAGVAQADTVNLLSFGNVNWNINTSPTTLPGVTIQIQNATTPAVNLIFNAYDLGFLYVLEPTVPTGSGSIKVSTAANPLTNSIINNWVGGPNVNYYMLGNEKHDRQRCQYRRPTGPKRLRHSQHTGKSLYGIFPAWRDDAHGWLGVSSAVRFRFLRLCQLRRNRMAVREQRLPP